MLPDYWIERPPLSLDAKTEAAVDAFASALAAGDELVDGDAILAEHPGAARWQVLCGVAERTHAAFHGTGDPRIELFEPRQPIDFAPFGDQRAVFATTDPIWAMYYAIVDRDRYALTLNNGCVELLDGDEVAERYYYFSVSEDALPQQPWRTGHLYLLPPDGFVMQPSATYAGHQARIPQLASPAAVRPFARLTVAPDDFPFLDRIRGHSDDRLAEYARAVMSAAPWPD